MAGLSAPYSPDGLRSATPVGTRLTPPVTGDPALQPEQRMGWIDALRGVAALFVVFRHLGEYFLVDIANPVVRFFDPGLFGVMVFFLVSGYIVPASLERRGSVRRFWISRIFRIYPMCVVAVGAAVLLAVTLIPNSSLLLYPRMLTHPATTVAANATMLQDLLGGVNAIPVMWTLSYEMVFYLLITALFVYGLHRRSAEVSVTLAVVAVAIGGLLPVAALTAHLGLRMVLLGAIVAMVAGLVLVLSLRRGLTLLGGALLAGLAILLVTTNARATGWESMIILATMFAGTAIYRADQGQISTARAGVVVAVVVISAVAVGAGWHRGSALATRVTWTTAWSWVISIVLAWATFAAAMAIRNRRMPRALTWLGSISYSVYLVHTLVLSVVLWAVSRAHLHGGHLVQLGIGLAYVAMVLAVSQVTYRLVELPGQRLGRRLMQAADRVGLPSGAAGRSPANPAPTPPAVGTAKVVPPASIQSVAGN